MKTNTMPSMTISLVPCPLNEDTIRIIDFCLHVNDITSPAVNNIVHRAREMAELLYYTEMVGNMEGPRIAIHEETGEEYIIISLYKN